MQHYICSLETDKRQGVNLFTWPNLLSLAECFGWEPQGTVLYYWQDNKTGEKIPAKRHKKSSTDGFWVKDEEWSGRYCIIEHQQITAEDGQKLAEALERALQVLPDNRDEIPKAVEKYHTLGYDISDSKPEEIEGLIYTWSGWYLKNEIRDWIDLFKSGPCTI